MTQKPKSLIQKKMIEARQHIKAKEYQEAQAILEKINHPTAKQWLQKIHKTWFEDTAKLVKAGKYEEALEILHNINHPKTAKWIAATEKKMLDVDPFAEEPEEEEDAHHPEVNRPLNRRHAQSTPDVTIDDYFEKRERVRSGKKQQNSGTPTWVLGVLATVVMAAVLALIYWQTRPYIPNEEEKDEMWRRLSINCEYDLDFDEAYCDSLFAELVDQYPAELWECYEPYREDDRWMPVDNSLAIMDCIVDSVGEDYSD
jgi:hypothetical protein